MIALAISAAFVGLVHSLSPGHWLPVVMVVKTKKWNRNQAALAAVVAASGHILVSLILGVLFSFIGHAFLQSKLHQFEKNAGWLLVIFGALYALYSLFSHRHCETHSHSHHGPSFRKEKAPYLFLFALGLSPCFAVLPIFAAGVGLGSTALLISMMMFSVGVLAAFMGGSLLVARGLIKLDHPFLEHYGDVITGAAVFLMGIYLVFFPHLD